VTDTAWIDAALTSARPQAIGALLRYFRNLDAAEEAYQNACLRALKTWPQNGPPRDPASWLIMVGRNAGIDDIRRTRKQEALPEEGAISDLDDAETEIAERLDGSHYRDDILRLLFICCHPDLPATQQIALALRIVSGLTVKQIARAFLVSEAAMEQRITRAKARIGMESMISRRDFLQATAAASAIVAASGLGPLGRVAAQQNLSQSDILRFDPVGTVTLLHVTDIHAQLVPLYFREPSINLGVGEVKAQPPHLTDEAFRSYYKIANGSADAYALTHQHGHLYSAYF
jgi:RNA polymerase sigma factor (sigma-70 family)